MSRWVVGVNVLMAGVALLLAVVLVREVVRPRPLPSPPPARPARTAPAPAAAAASPTAGETLAGYNVIVAKSLFNASRSENQAAAASSAAPVGPPPPKPVLLGMIVDQVAGLSVAYLQDPGSQRVLAYRVGDAVAGGRLERITDDRVVIQRPDGQVDVLLKDPSKPQLAAPPPAPGQRPPATPTPPQGQAERPPRPPRTPGFPAPPTQQ